MFNNFGCILEKRVLDEFIFIVTNQDIRTGDEVLKFDLYGIYKHLINCEIHNQIFVNYINNFAKTNKDPHILTENIRYLTYYTQKDDISPTN